MRRRLCAEAPKMCRLSLLFVRLSLHFLQADRKSQIMRRRRRRSGKNVILPIAIDVKKRSNSNTQRWVHILWYHSDLGSFYAGSYSVSILVMCFYHPKKFRGTLSGQIIYICPHRQTHLHTKIRNIRPQLTYCTLARLRGYPFLSLWSRRANLF